MGIRVYFTFRNEPYMFKMDDMFYYENVKALEDKNSSIWLKYLEETDCLQANVYRITGQPPELSVSGYSMTEIIRLITNHWDEVTEWEIF